MTARVGITASLTHDAAGNVHEDVVPYVRAVERFGGVPVLLENAVERLDAQLRAVDAVVVSGGVDVDVARYGGRAPHERQQTPRPERDAFEFALVRLVRERGVPTFCICRGLQVANVAFGGSLVEDLHEELGAGYSLNHRQTYENGQDRVEHAPGHEVALDPESALAGLLGTHSVLTNSMHHQAVRDVAPGLRVVGRTPDGTIEALDATFSHPFFFAVQWHPEELLADDATARLFGGLVAAGERVRAEARP